MGGPDDRDRLCGFARASFSSSGGPKYCSGARTWGQVVGGC